METVTTQKFFDGQVLHGPSRILLEEGRISGIETHDGETESFVITSGFVDLQMNGFSSVDVSDCTMEELIALDLALLSHGTTFWLATVITAPLDRLADRISFLDMAYRSGRVPGLLGIHIEGPFLGSAPGAHRTDWIVPIDMEWLNKLPDSVRLVTLAPEQPLASQATQMLRHRGVAVSMGHTRPTDADINQMIDSGSNMVTHLFNGMSGVHHREPGMALRALVDNNITAGLIADMSHVSPEAVALAFAAKGGDKVCLVSDTVAWDSERARRRGIQIVNGSPQLADGTLAGSSTPLSQCVQRCVQRASVNLEEALRAATSTPSQIIDRVDLSRVRAQSPANLVAMDESLCVIGAWRGLVSHRA
jgi:N-acetylglucosamine-6-phosphate deacetylase